MCSVFNYFDLINIPYGGKFSLVQNFVEMRPDSPKEIFVDFFPAERMHNTLTTPYQLMAPPHEQTEEMTLNDKEKKQA